ALAHATQQTDLDIGAFFNAEFVIRHGNTLPERSGVALSFCRRHANGFVQIDGTYSNLALVERLTLTATSQAGGPNGVIYYIVRDFPGYTTPTIALSMANNVGVCWSGQLVNGVLRVTFWATARNPFEVYVFDVASRGQRFAINYGLVVKNKTTGAVVFDSRMKYMRVLGTVSGRSTNGSFPTTDRSYPALKKIAVIQCVFWAWSFHEIIPDDPSNPSAIGLITASMITKPSATSVRLQGVNTYNNANRLSSNPVPNTYCASYHYIMLDISDYD
ncbi:hypothetical protein OO258_26890, partial [Pseudomonas sp. DCB_BI]|uniref:hypothetical protein n=1 Tax=Pseudomonas sp. DCB_BI TaxID=2993594 RepID=UPI00224B683F